MFGFLCTVHFIHTYTRIARREIQCPNTVKFNFYFLRRAFWIRHAIRSLLITVRGSSHVWKGDTPDDCDSNIFACSFSTSKTCSIPPPVKLGKLEDPYETIPFLVPGPRQERPHSGTAWTTWWGPASTSLPAPPGRSEASGCPALEAGGSEACLEAGGFASLRGRRVCQPWTGGSNSLWGRRVWQP